MRRALLFAVFLRAALGLIAIPLAPLLYRENVEVLVFLRPTKEVLLFAGFAARQHDVSLPVVVLAALPILLGGVWLFYGLGRVFGSSLTEKALPGLAGRLLPRHRIATFQSVLDGHGEKMVVVSRLAPMPSSLMAAAAGVAKLSLVRFLIVDAAGAVGSLGLMLGLGWFLEDAYEGAGPWVTGVGLAALAAVGLVVKRSIDREQEEPPANRRAASER